MLDLTAFLAAAEAESKMPSISVGMASGQIPPQLRELMFLAAEVEASHPAGTGAVSFTLPTSQSFTSNQNGVTDERPTTS